ncbi:hypothetical protein QQF64_031181 [Cirrhinus molitorella]|uniref:Uncharacterized protein n=1 Tax=Cirrhinus molitorella TaxID=172907 RepID=A0ABR3N5H1_9TELE
MLRNPDNYEAALGHLQAEGIRDVKGIKVQDPDDDVWQLTLQLKDVVDLVCAQKISVPQKWLFYTIPSVRSCLTYLMWQKTC